MKDFRDLKVWSKAHNMALSAYRLTVHFPKEEMYGLTSQIRRAGASIPANIAEGCGRDGDGELARFLQIAAGSASELEYHLLLSVIQQHAEQGVGEFILGFENAESLVLSGADFGGIRSEK